VIVVPRVAVGPRPNEFVEEAIRCGGGTPAAVGEPADGLVWLAGSDLAGLKAALNAMPTIRWIQLPSAGVESFAGQDLFTDGRIWTCAKGAYGEVVAEHALTLALAGLRQIPDRVRASSWGPQGGASLYDQPVTILGGRGIAQALIALLAPFRAQVTVVRRNAVLVPGAQRVLPPPDLHRAIPGALVVFVALALTAETTGIIGACELALMNSDAWLVNIARGKHVDTDALTAALERGQIAGAALDVTDPEPLPPDHKLWQLPNCILTPHTANTEPMLMARLVDRITANVTRFAAGKRLHGQIDQAAGY
jgi:phosphoglycerate dehydrogenase-like enzyme